MGKYIASFFLTLSLFLGYALSFSANIPLAYADETSTKAVAAPTTEQQRQELEAQLADLEKQEDEYQAQIDTYQKQGKTLSNELATLNAKIAKIKTQIQSVNLTLTKISNQITDTQKNINRTENQIDINRSAISKSIQNLYEADQHGMLIVLMANQKLSDFFGNIADVILVQNNVKNTLQEIEKLRENLVNQKQELTNEKQEAENLRAIQLAQQKSVTATQQEKNTVLKITKGKETEYQKLIAQNRAKAAEIRNRIFELLGGGQLTFDKAYNFAKIAENATGVRAALILGILHRETLLGKNVGQCTYNQIMKGGTTAMNPKDFPTFLAITSALGINPESVKISCPNADGTYGGAMGPSQFIPSTWKAFSDSIAKITGSNPPNPWNNSDAFVATGLYLKQSGAATQTAAAEKKAAAMYYCGGNWNRYSCNYYAGKVVETAASFQKDIDLLNSQ